MVFSVYKAATALLVVGSMGAEAASVAARTPTENDRVLRAGIKRSAHKRSLKIEPTFALDLAYIEGMWTHQNSRMSLTHSRAHKIQRALYLCFELEGCF